MKIKSSTVPAFGTALAALLLFHASSLFARDVQSSLEKQFPHVINYELGASGFADGDQITIVSVRGDRKHIEPGGSYLVEGTYTLASASRADLALFCTTRGPSGPTPIQDGQQIKITRGTGKFHLFETNLADGWLHVSFYPGSSSRGGVYFGEKGKEDTVMRDQSWFDKPGAKLTDTEKGRGSSFDSKANRALIAYLGDPVQPPADMDEKYARKGRSSAIQLAGRNAGSIPKRSAIDDSEYPFLVGVICAGSDAAKLKAAIKKMDGYEYQGSVGNDSNSDGSDTCNVFNIVPYQAQPRNEREQIHHRLMLRYQVFFDKIGAEE
jgi:hypothetical protein